MIRTEDEIRDSAKKILGFDEKEPNIKQGTGQITTFNQLGFKGILTNPMDGIYHQIHRTLHLFLKQSQKRRISFLKSITPSW